MFAGVAPAQSSLRPCQEVAMVSGVQGRLQHVRDLIAGSDPGLNRLRMAASGAGAMTSALGVEYVIARLRGADAQAILIAMLLGAMVSMMGSTALSGTSAWLKTRTAVFFPVAIGLGMLAGVAVAGHTDATLVVFVVVMFVAVFVRRFGPAFFTYGFMAWMGYFFAVLLHATAAMLPTFLADAAIGAGWVLLLSLTVTRTNPQRILGHVARAFGARCVLLADACAQLLATDANDVKELDRVRRRLHAQHTRLAEAGLMIEAWSADEQALPPRWSAQALRRRLLDIQVTLDRAATASEELTGGAAPLRAGAAETARLLARRDYVAAEQAAARLRDQTEPGPSGLPAGWRPARHFAVSVEQVVALARETGTPPQIEIDGDFVPAVTLAMGNLPGSPAVARGVAPRAGRWNPLARLDFTTRQAVQVAVAGTLAIVLGRQLDTTRYYWAVIAAFVAFTGTGTRSEAFLKAFNRVLGTLVGLAGGIWLAGLTAGHTPWILVVIVASMFCGFYLMRLSYAYMIFFITIMVAQLYSVLNELSDHLLVLRLEETGIGAAAGIAVALLVAPLSTRDTVAAAQSTLLTTLAELLDAAADRCQPAGVRRDATGHPDLDAHSRGLDNRLRELLQVAAR
jgi:uncharacterized membrane protein YccC